MVNILLCLFVGIKVLVKDRRSQHSPWNVFLVAFGLAPLVLLYNGSFLNILEHMGCLFTLAFYLFSESNIMTTETDLKRLKKLTYAFQKP